jgi:hypothetical protein
MAEAATDQKLGTLLRMHESAFREWGAVPEEILYDRMRTIWTGTDERGEIVWNAVFLDFARYWGFTPRLCRPYRAQTKGKVESGVKYVRRNFLCGLQGREPANLADLNAELRRWVAEVANQRIHGTTHAQVLLRWDEDQFAMQPVLNGRPPYPYRDDEQRKVARDAYVSWRGSRYSVPWLYAGKRGLGPRPRAVCRGPLRSRTRCDACSGGAAPSGGNAQRTPCGHTSRQQQGKRQDAHSHSAKRTHRGAPFLCRI